MPTYDYECAKCKHTFDIYQSFSEDKLKKCPKCNKKSLERYPNAYIKNKLS